MVPYAIHVSHDIDSLIRFSKSALEGALFYPAGVGELKVYLENAIKHPHSNNIICVAFVEELAIGVCFLTQHNQLLMFVKPEYRNHGIGSTLVAVMKVASRKEGPTLYGYSGEDEYAGKFWIKHGILHMEPYNKNYPVHSRKEMIVMQMQLWVNQQRQYREAMSNESNPNRVDR